MPFSYISGFYRFFQKFCSPFVVGPFPARIPFFRSAWLARRPALGLTRPPQYPTRATWPRMGTMCADHVRAEVGAAAGDARATRQGHRHRVQAVVDRPYVCICTSALDVCELRLVMCGILALFRYPNSSPNFTMQKEDSPLHQNVGTYMEY
jgi:hypothetical protein